MTVQGNNTQSVCESDRSPIMSNTNQLDNSNLDIDFEVSNLIDQYNQTTNSITLQPRLDVRIFPPALGIWRQLRNQQTRKVILELRIIYNDKLLATDHYPDWSVSFFPPQSLLSSDRSIQTTVDYRKRTSKDALNMINELMKGESDRLTHQINVGLNSLRMHYEHNDAREYYVREAMNALSTFMRRAKDNELAELNKNIRQFIQPQRLQFGQDSLQGLRFHKML